MPVFGQFELIINHKKKKQWAASVGDELTSERHRSHVEEREHQKARSQFQSLLTDCRIDAPQGLRLLELGFKRGDFLRLCRDAGLDAVGLEVEPGYYQRLKRECPELNLILYDGRAVPLPDASFDLIASFQVLEHVGSLETTLAECIRLLKPGGLMYHVLPNYHSFYEGHYHVFWWPFLSRAGGRRYLKMMRKYTLYYETLNLVKPRTLRRILLRHQDAVEVLSLGQDEFKKRFTPDQIAKVNHPLLRGVLNGIYRCGFLKKMATGLISVSECYYPITLIVRKKEADASPDT